MTTIPFGLLLGICLMASGALADDWCSALVCGVDPCDLATCPQYREADCVCRGCSARFVLNGVWLSPSDCALGGGGNMNLLTNLNPGIDLPDTFVGRGGGRLRLQNLLRFGQGIPRRFGTRPFGPRPLLPGPVLGW